MGSVGFEGRQPDGAAGFDLVGPMALARGLFESSSRTDREPTDAIPALVGPVAEPEPARPVRPVFDPLASWC